MIFESTRFWLIIFYAFVACAILFIVGLYRWLNHAKFRAENGEGLGVGYEEDATGHPVDGEDPDITGTDSRSPHVPVNPR
jgi:hypothetical protein